MAEFLNLNYLVNKYSRLGLIIDSGPLLVLIVGAFKPSELLRIGKYNEQDYKIILSFLKKFQRIIITPYIISELSNIAHSRLDKSHFKEIILGCVSYLKNFKEQQIKKDRVLNKKEAQWLGFTDVSVIITSEIQKSLVLTEDGKLITECEKSGIDVIDFTSLIANFYSKETAP